MERAEGGFLVDVWVSFHVLFFAVVSSVVLMLLNVVSLSNSIVVIGPLTLALFTILGRSSARIFRKLTSA